MKKKPPPKQSKTPKFQFETCVSRLSRIEASLSQTLNVNVDGDKNDGGYSFLSMDPHWDTLQRGGPWAPVDLTTLECMRHDFRTGSGKTDLILRYLIIMDRKKNGIIKI